MVREIEQDGRTAIFMDAISMLRPDARCVRSKLALFLRLWMVRHRYEQMRPFGNSSAESLRFHLRQLQLNWERVLEFQKVLGLDVVAFAPREQFESIYVISAYVERELGSKRNTIIDVTDLWREYARSFSALSHEINPFEFGEACARCCLVIQHLNRQIEPDEKVVPFNQRESFPTTGSRAATG
jgi:hypothetical protein